MFSPAWPICISLTTSSTFPKEREELPTRIEIIKMLKKGIPQHQIAENLGVGIATVTRGSKEIQQGTFKVIK